MLENYINNLENVNGKDSIFMIEPYFQKITSRFYSNKEVCTVEYLEERVAHMEKLVFDHLGKKESQ